MSGGAFWYNIAGDNSSRNPRLPVFKPHLIVFLQGLWVRLSARPGYKLGLEASAKLFIWELVHCLPQVAIEIAYFDLFPAPQVSLYRLAEPRGDLILYDR